VYLLETIEGNKGERLTSSVLKYLFINSDEFRRLFLGRIDKDFAASHIPVFKNGVICFHEYPTDGGDGFIDLVVVADNAVLGVENKLWAALAGDQPSKYLPTLKRLARERCGDDDAYKALMLVPEQRLEEVGRELDKQGVPSNARILLKWQSIMADLKDVARNETGEIATAAASLHEYLERRLGDVNVVADPMKLLGDVELGNVFQLDFLRKAWVVFDNAGRIATGGKGRDYKWYGFSFQFMDVPIEYWARPWFGFFKGSAGVQLVIETHQRDFPAVEPFASSEYSRPGNIRLRVTVDKADDSVPKWREKLQPVLSELRKRFESRTRAQDDVGNPGIA